MYRSMLIGAAAAGLLVLACSKSQPAASTAPPAPAPAPPPAPVAAAPFEGEIVVNVKDEASQKLPASIIYDVKGDKVRCVAVAAPVRALGDLDAQRVYAIDDVQREYDAMDAKPSAAKSATPPKVQKTGKMEKVAGLDCEDWSIDEGTEKVDVCASKGIAYVDLAADAKGGSAETPWGAALTSEKAFPLRVVVHDKAGKEAYRAEASRADRRKLDDALFALPIGYKTADLAKETRTASLP